MHYHYSKTHFNMRCTLCRPAHMNRIHCYKKRSVYFKLFPFLKSPFCNNEKWHYYKIILNLPRLKDILFSLLIFLGVIF